jgi:hypothetical protein
MVVSLERILERTTERLGVALGAEGLAVCAVTRARGRAQRTLIERCRAAVEAVVLRQDYECCEVRALRALRAFWTQFARLVGVPKVALSARTA